jgi:hypothetical protein
MPKHLETWVGFMIIGISIGLSTIIIRQAVLAEEPPSLPFLPSCNAPNHLGTTDATKKLICSPGYIWTFCDDTTDGDVISGKECDNGEWVTQAAEDPGFNCNPLAIANATICAGDGSGLAVNTPSTVVAACGAAKCEFTCNNGYNKEGNTCVSEVCNDNGTIQGPEQCDFGANNNGLSKSSNQLSFIAAVIPPYNTTINAYTCNSDCVSGTVLLSGGSCGDGSKQSSNEECEGAAIANCNAATCDCNDGYEPPSPESNECQSICNNGKMDGAEVCDSGAHCESCTSCSGGWISEQDPDDATMKICVPPPATCGNGHIDGEEPCDGGTHCAETCLCEDGYVKDPAADPLVNPGCKLATPAELCGNGERDVGEECDKDGGEHCGNTCQCSSGYEPIPGSPKALSCQKTCGNGEVDSGEECDGGDECLQTCECPSGYSEDGDDGCEEDDEEDEKKQCDDDEDNDNDGKKDYPADPGCSSKSDNSEIDSPKGAVEISDAEVFPVGFNPNMSETKISYKLSGDGVVELVILDEAGVKVATLVDNEEVEGDLLFTIPWDGKGNDDKIVKPGTYFFKLTVKASEDAAASDTKTGEINVIYTEDFEGVGVAGNPSGSSSGAVSVMHNTTSGETSGTGPETAIYLILPLVGFIGARFAHKRK